MNAMPDPESFAREQLMKASIAIRDRGVRYGQRQVRTEIIAALLIAGMTDAVSLIAQKCPTGRQE